MALWYMLTHDQPTPFHRINNNMKTSANLILDSMFATGDFGEFFGVSQEVFDRVWRGLTDPDGNSIAYISMEIGADPDVYNPVRDRLLQSPLTGTIEDRQKYLLDKCLDGPQKIPNYSGGLGILAGDTLKSFADCRLPVVAVSLLYRQGYFAQFVDSRLGQISQQVNWQPEDTPGLYQLHDPYRHELPLEIEVPFFAPGNREIVLTAQVWMKMEINHSLDFFIPEILLDFYRRDSSDIIQRAAAQLYDSESSLTRPSSGGCWGRESCRRCAPSASPPDIPSQRAARSRAGHATHRRGTPVA